MDELGFVSVDLESKLKNRNESETEDEPEFEMPRKRAGFEWSAEPDEMLFPCCATKFVMMGISGVLTLISIIAWIVANSWTDFVWLTIETLFIGLIIFLPEYFSNILNFAVNFCIWVAFCIFCLACGIKNLVDSGNKHIGEDYRKEYRAAGIFDFIELIGAICVTILMFRMLYYYYQNRGNDDIVAVAA